MTELLQEIPFSESRNATKATTCKIIVAVPVLPYDTLACLKKILMNVFNSLKDFRGVGCFYEDFQQVEDDEVIQMLKTTHPLHK
jgi:predicted phosphoribosyltransferase